MGVGEFPSAVNPVFIAADSTVPGVDFDVTGCGADPHKYYRPVFSASKLACGRRKKGATAKNWIKCGAIVGLAW